MAGNANSGPRKAKVWRDALMLALNRPDDEPIQVGRTMLHKLVAKQLEIAHAGDTTAIRDIADRIDGKPAQAIVGGDEDDNPLRMINTIELIAAAISNTDENPQQ